MPGRFSNWLKKTMNKLFTENGWTDYVYWESEDRKILNRINRLIEDISRNGNEGIGRPEPLTGNLSGFWSRRINDEHRLVYKLTGTNDPANGDSRELFIVQCATHYE